MRNRNCVLIFGFSFAKENQSVMGLTQVILRLCDNYICNVLMGRLDGKVNLYGDRCIKTIVKT